MAHQNDRALHKGVEHIRQVEHVILEVVVPSLPDPAAVPVTPCVDGDHPIPLRQDLRDRVPGPGLVEESMVQEDGLIGAAGPLDHVNLETPAIDEMVFHVTPS